jgi:hypothetical protein
MLVTGEKYDSANLIRIERLNQESPAAKRLSQITTAGLCSQT